MRRTGWSLSALALITIACVFGQLGPSQPDAQGVYSLGKGVEPPKLISAAAAAYPDDPELAAVEHVCWLVVVVGPDGIPAAVAQRTGESSPVDKAAIAAVKQSRFKAGTFGAQPVPVRILVWVPFKGGNRPAVPEVFSAKKIVPPAPLSQVEA